MDFITRLPRTVKHHDSIMVVVAKLAKATNLIPVQYTHKGMNITEVFTRELVTLNGVPRIIVFDKDTKFNRTFRRVYSNALGTQLNFNTTNHLQNDGQNKRVTKVTEDILSMYVMDKSSKRGHLQLVDFAYNNGQQASLRMS
jgi:hypothetical protein